MELNNITVTCIEDTESFMALRAEWDALLSNSAERDVFLTWEWLYAWWKNIGQKNRELKIFVASEAGKVIGILPCMLHTKKKSFVKLKWLENLGYPDCDVAGMITAEPEKVSRAILEHLRRIRGTWDILEWHELSGSSRSTAAIKNSLGDLGIDFKIEREDHYFIDTSGRWEDYYNLLSKNMKHNFKRRVKRAGELGTIKVERFALKDLDWKHFLILFKISEKSNFPDLYQSDSARSFHRDLFDLMQDKGWVQIEFLSLNDSPIAFQYGFNFEGRYEDWRGGIDKDYDGIAPGKLLLMYALEDRFRLGVRENDFLRGDHEYKKDWQPQSREFIKIQAFNPKSAKAALSYIWIRIKKLLTVKSEEGRGE